MKLRAAVALLLISTAPLRADNEIGFTEKFALASDRESVLTQLIPGSPDYYFFYALHYQNTRQAAKLQSTMEAWAKRFPDSEDRKMIENRAALLQYDANPQATLKFLRDRLQVQLNHEQQVRDRVPELPHALDPARIALVEYQNTALSTNDDLSGFSDAALARLVREKVALSVAQRRALLARLKRPDIAGLVDIIAADLQTRESRGFGEFPIHAQLLPEQLDDLARRLPALTQSEPFVTGRLKKLLPGEDADAVIDPKEREQWLDRAWSYVSKLPPSFNTLKAQILFQRLQHDQALGIYDKARFLEYLKLPRRTGYMNPRYIDQPELARFPVDLNARPAATAKILPPIGNDEALVRDYLLKLLADEEKWEPWAVWLRDAYVKKLFAESKIVNGIGDPEQWASLLSPSEFKTLKERVDVDFSPANRPNLAPADPVSVDVFVKNVPKLIVKIYEINTLAFYLSQKKQLNTDLNLDGLVANSETTRDLSDEAGRSPFRRVLRTFDFPELRGRRGAWMIEFIGGGKSSRALVRKGHWQLIQQAGPAGDMLTVVDEKRQPIPDAVAWLDGRRLASNEKAGFIVAPFTNAPGKKQLILADAAGTFASLTSFEHHAEQYQLDAQFHIEREQLLAGKEATVVMRTSLLVGGTQLGLELLQEPKLMLTTTNLDGVAATREITDLKLDSAKDWTFQFPVPDRLASVAVTLTAKIEKLSAGGEKQDLAASRSFSLNTVDRGARVFDGFLSKFGDQFVFELLGKNGEPLPNQVVSFTFKHQEFTRPADATLSTDEAGRIRLGPLPQIEQIRATIPNGLARTWALDSAGALRPPALHAALGGTFVVPWTAADARIQPGQVSLLEQRESTFVKDWASAVKLVNGSLEIRGLPAGDFLLSLPQEDKEITLRVTDGQQVRNWILSENRQLELRAGRPVQIESVREEAGAIIIQTRNANPFTRLHLAVSRFLPSQWNITELSGFERFALAPGEPSRRPNLFVSGRAIGDEYRYILDRRYTKAFPGNMLSRPGLLLNPWEVRSTDLAPELLQAAAQLARAMGDRDASGGASNGYGGAKSYPGAAGGIAPEETPDLDFLAQIAPTQYDLTPDENGIVRIERAALGDRQYLQVYAEDLTSAAWKNVALAEVPTKFEDRRLLRGLDPQKLFTEKKDVATLTTGQPLTLADVLTSEFATYDSLATVYTLFAALNPDPQLKTFGFILQWPKLKPEEKRAKYSEFACHELSFFLSKKDPEFFEKVIKPYLSSKKDKTFMDDYLLGNDLKRYLEPWNHARLNVVEQALLGRRMPAETAAAARRLRELWEMVPQDPEREDRLFETGLRGRTLAEGADGKEFKNARSEAAAAGFAETSMSAPAPEVVNSPAAKSLEKASDEVKPADRLKDKANKASEPVSGPKSRQRKLDTEGTEPAADGMFLGGEELAKQLRESVRQYFRELGPTKEWAENNYYKLPIAQQDANLVTINAFWRDFAAWDGKTPFLSGNVAEASRNFTEIMLALAVLDLPFEPARHATKAENGSFSLTAASPAIVFHKQIKPAAKVDANKPGSELMISQNFFRADDRYREDGNERFDNYVTDEFLTGVLYGANVVVTNPGSAPQKLELLLQIPRGALPASGSKMTDSRRVPLEPYTTKTFNYFFYFPLTAERPYIQYPATAALKEEIAGAANPFTFTVVNRLTNFDKTSWDYVSQYGTDEEVFTFIRDHNAARLDFEKIAWRARKSPEFFHRITALLAQLHVWSEPVYRYAFVHNDPAALREWLRHRDDFVSKCGPWLETTLLDLDPIERRTYEHLEYSPLVNQRTHRIGAENKIQNQVLLAQYQHLMKILSFKPALDAEDSMSVVSYLLLQDRVEEGLARFHQVTPEALPTRVQYDYFRCYAAFYEEQLGEARTVAAAYATYPVDRWKQLFAEVAAQADEIEGKFATRSQGGKLDREQQQATLAGSEPSFDFKVEGGKLTLNWKNLDQVVVNYYLMDPEFLFSASPFVTEDPGRFSIVKPTSTTAQPLPADADHLEIAVPEIFGKANVLVEVVGAGQRKTQASHSNTLRLTLAENYGQLEARDIASGKAVAKAYVKVYARLKNGAVRYFKDGYTDLRGKFDYASLNSSDQTVHPMPIDASARGGEASGLDHKTLLPSELNDVERLAILIMSEGNGAAVREVNPPTQ